MNLIAPSVAEAKTISVDNIQPKKNNVKRVSIYTNSVDKVEKFGGVKSDEKATKMLLALIKSSLSGEEIDKSAFKGANYHDWAELLKVSNRSSMTGFVFDSLGKLPKGTVPVDITFKMADFVKEIENKYARQEAVIGDISKQLSEKGIDMVALKGLGLSLNYPVPQHRHGRDIDVFTRLKGTVTEGRSNATEILDDMMMEKGIKVEDYRVPNIKHSEFFYNDLMVENHKYFVNKESYPEAIIIDKILHKKLNPVEKILPNGTKILVPSSEFNSIFLAQHAFQHYAGGGIDLHNLVDWGMHIKENGLEVPKELKGTKIEKFMYALTNVSNKYLGTKVKVPENPEYEKDLFSRILNPDFKEPVPQNAGELEVLWFKTKRFVKTFNERRALTGKSFTKDFAKAVIHSIKAHLRKPETILRV